jgi:hypothetical protein
MSGFPDEQVSIQELRPRVGAAAVTAGDTTFVSTFGECNISHHGSISVQLRVEVPLNIEIVKAAGLAGPRSAANREFKGLPVGNKDEVPGSVPKSGWTRIACKEYDPNGGG